MTQDFFNNLTGPGLGVGGFYLVYPFNISDPGTSRVKMSDRVYEKHLDNSVLTFVYFCIGDRST